MLPTGSENRWIRRSWTAGLGAFAVLTAVLALRTHWYLFHSWSNVPWRDQWPLLEEIQGFEEGRYGWSYLWTPYWGVRIVIPRLLFLFSGKFFAFSNKPLVILNLMAQVCTVVVLGLAAWRVLKKRRIQWRWLALIVIINLLLSPLQMENIIWGMGVEFTIGYAAGLAAIVIFGRRSSLAGAIFFALISTLCIGAGLILWPLLCFESWMLGRAKRNATVLGMIGIAALIAYMPGYHRPDMGIGMTGFLVRPISAFNIAGLILGGPISIVSRFWSTAAGYVGLIAACYLFYQVFRERRGSRAELVVPAVAVLFFLGMVASIVAGRISPEWLSARQGAPLPSRYFTPAFLFWASLVPALLALEGGVARAVTAVAGAVVIALTIGTTAWQLEAPGSWAFLFRSMDAAASGFFTGASDEQYQSAMFPEKPARDRGIDYLRRRRWSVFADERAGWMGKPLQKVFSPAPPGLCRFSIESVSPISPAGALRITGRITADRACSADPVEILITGPENGIIGLGRPFLPVFTPFGGRDVPFLAYAALPSGEKRLRIYASLPGNRATLICDRPYSEAAH